MLFSLFILLSGLLLSGDGRLSSFPPLPRTDARLALLTSAAKPPATAPIDLIVVAEDEQFLLAVAAPLAARLRTVHGLPYVLALATPPSEAATTLTRRLNLRRSLVLTSHARSDLGIVLGDSRIDLLAMNAGPMRCGATVARRFWGTSDQVVVASTDDPGAMILGSMLAAHYAVPFIPATRGTNGSELWPLLSEIGANRILVATCQKRLLPKWARNLPEQARLLDKKALYRALFSRMNAANVCNVILARTPERLLDAGEASWMAPYLSLARGAPIVLSETDDGPAAQGKVDDFVASYGLRPRSVTIVGDYEAIGEIHIADEEILGEYEVAVEPCSGWGVAYASAYAVGRFPFPGTEDTSTLVVRGLARERLTRGRPADVLMVANPKTDHNPLPFCETVSRATAREFRNCDIRIREFYGVPSDASDILDALRRADLVLYEGHVSDQRIFEDTGPPVEEGYYTDAEDAYYSDDQDSIREERPSELDRNIEESTWTGEVVDGVVFIQGTPPESTPNEDKETVWESERPEEFWLPPARTPVPLTGFPLVVVQSCHSLEDWLADAVFEAGGAGLVGSMTNIHSASGSAFIKAFCDGMLYRGDTVGEALRDARNYFLCVGELKTRRGHKQQAKVYRVALSFRLWGDPEMRILHTDRPHSPPHMAAQFQGLDKVIVSTPANRLPTSKTEKYVMRNFPGSEVAGIVQRQKDTSARRLLPIYFFRLPMPEGFAGDRYTSLRRTGDKTPRGVFLTDPLERYVYVLYYPWTERREANFVLQFE